MPYRPLVVLFIFFSNIFIVAAQEEWTVPDDKKNKLSSFEFVEETINSGSEVFSGNCASCHGEPGKGNYVPLVPPPGDPGSDVFQSNTDGELYYKIREGRGSMPSFKNTLTSDQAWGVISYIRSFSRNYVQEITKEIERGVYDGDVSISLIYLEDKNLIKAKVTGNHENTSEPISGAGIQLVVKRMFGNLLLDEPKITNKEGVALFSIAVQCPGDATGNINLIAQLTDQETFGVITAETIFCAGIPTDAPSLVATRALWNKMSKAPVWLFLAYTIAVAASWATIFFILFQIRKIYLIGKEN